MVFSVIRFYSSAPHNMSPIAFQFETGQSAPASCPPRRYVRRPKGPTTAGRTSSQRGTSSTQAQKRSAFSPLAVEYPEQEFRIIVEDPTIPKDRRKFIEYVPHVPTWTAPFSAADVHLPPSMSSFSIASAVVSEDTKPPPMLNSGVRAPTENATRPPRPRTPHHARTQRGAHHHYHHNHIPVAAPSLRLSPVHNRGAGARRVRRPSEQRVSALPRLPLGVRVIARPGEWDGSRSHMAAGPSRSAASGTSSSLASGSGPISQLQVVIGAPTHPTPTEPIIRTFWNTVL